MHEGYRILQTHQPPSPPSPMRKGVEQPDLSGCMMCCFTSATADGRGSGLDSVATRDTEFGPTTGPDIGASLGLGVCTAATKLAADLF